MKPFVVAAVAALTLTAHPAGAQDPPPANLADVLAFGTVTHPFFVCVRAHESDMAGGYRAQNRTSTASGAYQFLDSTWVSIWRRLLRTDPPAPKARLASPRDQGLAAAAAFLHGEQAHWRGTDCGWGT